MTTAKDIITKLNLKPLPQEGGYYFETYRSNQYIASEALDGLYPGPRSVATAIYYLVTPETFSVMHRIIGDEMFHFYAGDPIEMFQILPDGTGVDVLIGNKVMEGQHPQVLVKGGVWQGLRLQGEGKWALMGTTVAPGFEFEDFEVGDRDVLCREFPQHQEKIIQFT